MNINGNTSLYGVIGNPVGHSLSPVMHNAALAALGINGAYVPLNVVNVGDALIGLKALGFRGVSITIPHKETILEFLDVVDPVAERIGAVNTLLLKNNPDDGATPVVHGFNTDWLGARMALEEHISLAGRTVLVAGAGGAAKAVGYGLHEAGAKVLIVNRTEKTGRKLADWLGCGFVSFGELASVQADILVNTTSVGMVPRACDSVIDPDLLPGFKVVMDIVYAPLKTRLLQDAEAAGCVVIDGLAMLLCQGAAQFEIWTGQRPPLDVMRQALESELQVDDAVFDC